VKAAIRVRMATRDGHYGGGLVDGAKILELFGDVATELCIRADGDEGLFRAYESVEFLRPVRAGDYIEAEGEIIGWGRTSLKMRFEARKVIAPAPEVSASAANILAEPEVVVRAVGTCVVPAECRRPAPAGVREVGRPGPCILTAAIVGAETTRQQTPHLPLTAEELGAEAARCAAAGATVIHLHVRHDDGRPSQDTELFRKAIRAIRARCDVVIQTSTGGAIGMSVDERCGALHLEGADAPEMATLNVGTMNFGDEIFENPLPMVMEVARRIRARGCVPEVEVYDAGHLDITAELVKKELVSEPLHVQFVLGIRGGMAANARNLDFLIEGLGGLRPGYSWGVAGVGRHELPLAELAIVRGGNVRVGLEDNIYLEKGVLAEGSAPLVAKAAEMIRARGRTVATIEETRRILGTPRRH
jgi:3-keto-5-aminohexanoate cleavage enzyme